MTFPRPLLFAVLATAALLQLAAPAYFILRQETTLREGCEVWVPCRAIDPFDPIRGRYVIVNPTTVPLPLPGDGDVREGQRIYLLAGPDDGGRLRFTSIALARPAAGESCYLEMEAAYAAGGEMNVRLPFDRYYMNEKAAPRAEAVWREAVRRRAGEDGEPVAELRLRLHDGHAAVDGLFIDGVSIEERLSAQP